MANIYVRSTDGDNADNGSTWALAKATGSGAAAIDVAGDTVFFSQVHAESTAGIVAMAWAGTILAPTRLICANDGAEPPTAVAATATITCTGASSRIEYGGNLYAYGITHHASGTGASNIWLSSINNKQVYEQCSFQLNSTTASTLFVNSGSTTTGDIVWKNCTYKIAAVGTTIQPAASKFTWEGGSVISGSSSPTALFTMSGSRYGNVRVSGVDFSSFGTGFYFAATGSTGSLIISNCKLPASWTGDLYNGVVPQSARFEMYNCDGADTNYRIRIKDFTGDLRDETTLVKTGGASDGVTPISWKIATTVNCNWTIGRFETPLMARWNSTIGSAITVTVDFLRDSVTNLTDDDVWLEVQYLGTTGFPLSVFIADVASDILASPTAQPASSATWTTTGMSNPNKQYASVTFTPREVGYIQAKIICGIASTTIYIDPALQIS